MQRIGSGLAAWLVLAAAVGAQTGDTVPPGNYKITLLLQKDQPTYWLIKIAAKDGKPFAEVLAAAENIPEATISGFTVGKGAVKLVVKTQGRPFVFDGKLPPDSSKKVLGSFTLGAGTVPAVLEPTTLTSLDSFDISKQLVAEQSSGPEVFGAALTLLRLAEVKKAKIEEVRTWSAKAMKAAEPYGEPWQREVAARIAESLARSEEFAPVALLHARQAERLLAAGDNVQLQRRILGVLGDVLDKAGKPDEAKEVRARVDKLPLISIEKYAGRKAKSDRVVLIELFTGTECSACVATDLACDALVKSYSAKEVVLLQYHEHIPRPDPLTNLDAEARLKYYADEITGTPTIFFNGELGPKGGGPRDAAQDKYLEYSEVVNEMLEVPAKVKLEAKAVRTGSKISISAAVSDLAAPGDRVRLRLALVEDEVAYTGQNKLTQHHAVVRALPGGAAGQVLKDKAGKATATIDLDELRKSLTQYLNDYAAKEAPFGSKDRPMEFKNLRVVAWVQNDVNKEVFQAVVVPVEAK